MPRHNIRDDQGRFAKWPGGGSILAVVLAVAIGAGGSAGLGASASAAGGSSVSAAGGNVSIQARSQTRRQDSDRIRTRLLRKAQRVESRFDTDDDCAAHSYGEVRDFFRTHPCVALHRAWFDVRDSRRGLLLVAVSWVEMPDAASARAYKDLVDTYGTGNVTELSREEGPYRRVRFTGRYYESRRDGAAVVNAQAEPVGRAAAAAELEQLAEDALG